MSRSTALSLYLLSTRSDVAGDGADRLPRDYPRRPAGQLIWFHTGRSQPPPAIFELLSRLASERGGLGFLLTTSAPDARASGPHALGSRVEPAPPERSAAIRRFIEHWRPSVAVWSECDLRPALIHATAEARIPLLMIDAGTARPAAGAIRWRRGMTRALITQFRRILAGDAAGVAEFLKMGAPEKTVEPAGYLEEGSPALPCNEAERAAIAELLSGRPVWLATGITPKEADVCVTVQQLLLQHAHRLLLIIVPGDVDQGALLASRLRAADWSVGLRSDGDEPEPGMQIYVADLPGEDGIWYRLAPVSFVGGSLFRGTGRNPYDAAALGSAIVHGPHLRDHRDAYARLSAAGAARLVRSADELRSAVETLQSPEAAARMARAAWAVGSAGAQVTDRTIELILAALDGEDLGPG